MLFLISLSMGGDDYYIYGLRRCINKNIDYNVNLIKNNINQNERDFVNFIEQKTDLLENLYEEFFSFRVGVKAVTEAISDIIENFFLKINCNSTYSEYVPNGNDNSNTFEEEIGCDENPNSDVPDNNYNFIKDKKTRIFNENNQINKSGDTPSFHQYRFLVNKSNFLYTIIRVINFITKSNKTIDSTIYNKIMQLICFFCDDHPDNVVIIFSHEFLFSLCKFPIDHAEKIFDFFIVCLRTLIKYEYELTYTVKIVKIITTYFININVSVNVINNSFN